jgi:hypothetical protein
MMKPVEQKLYTEHADDVVLLVQQYVDLHVAGIQKKKKQQMISRVQQKQQNGPLSHRGKIPAPLY